MPVIRTLTLALAMACAAGPALPDCMLCTRVVELTDRQIACFLEHAAHLRERAESSRRGRIEVSMEICGETKGLRFYDRNAEATVPDEPEVTQSMVLDLAAIQCLEALLSSGAIQGRTRIDLTEACS